jgi:HAD superfamily hydrolase (TIGR01662 family)
MLPFKVILFDLGNTLIYFDADWQAVIREGISKAVNSLIGMGYRLDQDGFAAEFLKVLQDHYSRRSQDYHEIPSEQLLRSLLVAHGHSLVSPAHLRTALNALYAVSQAHWRVEPDATATLRSLETLGCKLGMISNAGDTPDVQTLVNNAGLRPFFKKIWISAEVGFRKPHPRMYELALDYFQVAPKEAVMVGDSLAEDILGAINMGIATIWLTRRADTPENQANKLRIIPDHTVQNLEDLPWTLMNW